MELINYLISLILILITVFLRFNPTNIPSFKTLSDMQKENYPFDKLIWGGIITASLTPLIAYNIRFVGYSSVSCCTFLITVPIGLIITFRLIKKKLNQY